MAKSSREGFLPGNKGRDETGADPETGRERVNLLIIPQYYLSWTPGRRPLPILLWP